MTEIKEYRETVEKFYKQLEGIPDAITAIKLTEDSWSLREIVGHLIDSASNNHQRFMRLQFDDLLNFPVYEAESWVKTQHYNSIAWSTLVGLWYSFNCLLLNIIEHIPQQAMTNVWVKNEEAMPLSELIPDYYKHMKLHMEHFGKRYIEITK